MKKLIETYKGVDIYYLFDNGILWFEFEGNERKVKYVFEAHEIIDSPQWEPCQLEGYFVDGVFKDFIGLAKAERKDVKSGIPEWKFKGEYKTDYRLPDNWMRETKVFEKDEKNNSIYQEWKNQDNKVSEEKMKLMNIIHKLSNT